MPGSDLDLDPDPVPNPRRLLGMFGLKPKEALGQNFLLNRGVAGKIVRTLDPLPGETILEIGAGLGHLTVPLADKAFKVTAVELDRDLINVLQEVAGGRPNVDIVHADADAVDLRHIFEQAGNKLAVVGNLPFNRSMDIFCRLLDQLPLARHMVLMFQKEVAQRLTARPGNRMFGAPTVISAAKADLNICFHIRPGSFYPRPQVEASVVRIKPRIPPLLAACCFVQLERLVKAVFAQRRKTLRNALKSAGLLERIVSAGHRDGEFVDLNARPEEIAVERFVQMASMMCRCGGPGKDNHAV